MPLFQKIALGGIQRLRSLRRGGGGVLKKQAKMNRERGEVSAGVYVRFLKKKCLDFQNQVL